jgi:UDP-N-acetylglucosamine:LPS N-acetylglucosamine transferase
MADILIFPLPEAGHTLPTLAVARGLTAQGHRVVYISTSQFASQIASVGGAIEPLILEGDAQQSSGSSIWYRFASDHRGGGRTSRLQALVRSLLNKRNFTLVLCDRILEAKYHSGLTDIIGRERTILFSTSLFNWSDSDFEGEGCPTLVFCPECFELPKFRISRSKVFYVEPSLRPIELESKTETVPLTNLPLVIVAFGTQNAKYRNLAQSIDLIVELARRRQELHFALATGNSPVADSFGHSSFPPNLSIAKYLPQRRLLKTASAMITHGGLGSIKEAIFQGVPLIVLPMLHDQPFNAMRVRHHKLGEAVFPEKVSVSAIEDAVLHAVSGVYAPQICRMQARFVALERSRISQLLINNHLAFLENVAK